MNWLNMALVYWMILLTANSLLIVSHFPGLDTSEQSKIASCLPDSIKKFGPNIAGNCDLSAGSTGTNVAASSTDLVSNPIGILEKIGKILTGIAGGVAGAIFQIIPGATVAANFISNFLFGYLAFFNYLLVTFSDLKFVLFILGGVVFTVQLMGGFYFILTLLSAASGGGLK